MALKTQFPAPTGKSISSPDSRLDLAGMLIRTTAGVPRAGILPRHTSNLVTARASMGLDVAAFEAAVVRTGLPAFIANDGTTTVPGLSAPVANSQYSVLYAKQNEAASPFSDGNDNAIFGYVSSPAGPSPSESAALALVPPGGLALASVLIPSTAVNTLSAGVVVKNLFPYTALTDGRIWARSKAEIDLLTGFAQGTLALDITANVTYEYFALWDGTTNPGGASVAGWYPVAGAMPAAKIFGYNAVKAVASGVETVMDQLTVGARGWAKDMTVSSGAITVPLTGRYRVKAAIGLFTLSPTGSRIALTTKNNSTTPHLSYGPAQAAQAATYPVATSDDNDVRLAAGDVIRALVYQNSGGSVNVTRESDHQTGYMTYLEVAYLGPIIGAA